jgi:hypothetical protein
VNFILGIPRCNEPPEIFAQTLAAVAASSVLPKRVFIIDNGDEPLGSVTVREPPAHAPGNDIIIPVHVVRSDRNLGCAGSWNLIHELGAPRRTIILNADCAVPTDAFEKILAVQGPTLLCAFGFGCFRLDAEIYTKVGPFDEAYYPVYFEDTDYRYRCKLAGVVINEWPFIESERLDHETFGRARYTTGFEHGWRHTDGRGYQGWTGEKAAWFQQRWEKNRDRYIAKWGGTVGEEKFTQPFDGKVIES